MVAASRKESQSDAAMSVAVRHRMTTDEFLAWEEQQELRWEFNGFAPVAMTGGTAGHSAIQRNLIRVAGSIRYPDAPPATSSKRAAEGAAWTPR